MDEPGSLSALIIFLSGSVGLNAHFVKAKKRVPSMVTECVGVYTGFYNNFLSKNNSKMKPFHPLSSSI